MEYTTGRELFDFLQTAAPVSLIATAGLVLVPRLWDSPGKDLTTMLATSAVLIPMGLVSVAAVVALAGPLPTATILLYLALILEPPVFAIALFLGYLATRKVDKIKPSLPYVSRKKSRSRKKH